MNYFLDARRIVVLSIVGGAFAIAWPTIASAQIPDASAPSASDPVVDGGPPAMPVKNQAYAIHGQSTLVVQSNLPFRSRFEGANSLRSTGETRETADLTLYLGVRPWAGAEIWINPELDQGFGLRNTLGAAGFPNGEAYKVGKRNPYLRLQRAFIRQTINLGGEEEKVAPDLNQLGGAGTANRMVLTFGKFSVSDIFDTNAYAHDPRADFLNWTVIEAGTFDYAADAWGYSLGGAAELYLGRWAMRGGLFNLSTVPNGEHLEKGFGQYELVGEIEERHSVGGHPGKLRITGFLNHGMMGRLSEATNLSALNGQAADVSLVRRFATRAGISLNLEQELTASLGFFVRAGIADGRYEAFEFTDVDRTFSAGLSIAGKTWGRADDRLGLAIVVNGASPARKRYLDAGGLGVLIGDGRLPQPGDEDIVEAYYECSIAQGLHVTPDFQLLYHPAYNRDRGPVAVLGVRLHGQF